MSGVTHSKTSEGALRSNPILPHKEMRFGPGPHRNVPLTAQSTRCVICAGRRTCLEAPWCVTVLWRDGHSSVPRKSGLWWRQVAAKNITNLQQFDFTSCSHPQLCSAAVSTSQPGFTDNLTSLLLHLLRFKLQRKSCQSCQRAPVMVLRTGQT